MIEVAAGLDAEDSLQELLCHVSDSANLSNGQRLHELHDLIHIRSKFELAVGFILIGANLEENRKC